MEKNSFKIVTVIDFVLLLVSIYANYIGIVNNNADIQYILNLVAIALALVYCFVEYKKNGNLYYRLFSGFLAVKEMVVLAHVGVYEDVPAFTFFVFTICFGVYLLIAVAKDLGKVLSMVLAGINIVLSAIAFAFVAVNAQYIDVITYNSTRVVLTLVLMVMVYAKYKDKSNRGSK